MSTALSTHHRISDPLATAAAVLVIIAGAGVIGLAVAQDESTSAPSAPNGLTHGRHTSWNPGDRIGLGDFTAPDQGGLTPPLKGGHTMPGQP